MLRLKVLAALVASSLLASPIGGSCALWPYAFRGSIRRQCDGPMVPGAHVFIFLDDQDRTLANGAETRYPDFFTSDRKGKFSATAYFDTFTSYDPQSGHRCDRKPSRVELVITHPRYLTKRAVFELSQLKSTQNGDVQVFELPAVELEACGSKS